MLTDQQKRKAMVMTRLLQYEVTKSPDHIIRIVLELLAKLEDHKTFLPVKGQDYFTEDEINKFLEYVTPQKGVHYFDGKNGAKGENGKDGAQGRDGKDGLNGKDGKNGKNGINGISGKDGLNGLDGKDGLNGKDGIHADTKSVIEALKKLKGKDRLSIKHLQDVELRAGRLLHGGGDTVKSFSCTPDGFSKTFTIPTNTKIILVTGSDAPIVYKPNIDWTGSGTTTLTLTDQVNAPSLGATLEVMYAAI